MNLNLDTSISPVFQEHPEYWNNEPDGAEMTESQWLDHLESQVDSLMEQVKMLQSDNAYLEHKLMMLQKN